MKPIDMIFNVLTGPRPHPLREFAPTEAERNPIRIRAYQRRLGDTNDPFAAPHALAQRCAKGIEVLKALQGYWNRSKHPRLRRKPADAGNVITIVRTHRGERA